MPFALKNSLYTHVLVAVFSLSLIVSYPCGLTHCHSSHDHARAGQPEHKAHRHGGCSNSHLTSVYDCHDGVSSQECCKDQSHNSNKCTQEFVLQNRTNTAERTQSVSLSAPIVVDCSQFSERNFISEISNSNNPTLLSLRTIILLV